MIWLLFNPGAALAQSPAQDIVALLDEVDRLGADRALKRLARAQRKRRDQPGTSVLYTVALQTTDTLDCTLGSALLERESDPVWVPWRELTLRRMRRSCGGPAWPSAKAATASLMGAWDQALADVSALESDPLTAHRAPPLRADLLEARAALYFASGAHEPAVTDLRAAIALDSTPDRRLRLGLSLMPLGDEREARAQLTVGLVMDGATPELADRARIALSVMGPPEPELPEPPVIGDDFPDLVVHVGDDTVRLSSFDGPLVVDLWATWCGPCVAALPHLADRAEEWRNRGVTVVGVNVDQHRLAFEVFQKRTPLGYPTGWGGPPAMEAAGVVAIPAIFVLDASHRVAGFVPGFDGPDDDRLDRAIESLSL